MSHARPMTSTTWRVLGAGLATALVAAPWLVIAVTSLRSTPEIDRLSASLDLTTPEQLSDELRSVSTSSAWVPPLSDHARRALHASHASFAGASPSLRPLRESLPSPELLVPQAADVHPLAAVASADTVGDCPDFRTMTRGGGTKMGLFPSAQTEAVPLPEPPRDEPVGLKLPAPNETPVVAPSMPCETPCGTVADESSKGLADEIVEPAPVEVARAPSPVSTPRQTPSPAGEDKPAERTPSLERIAREADRHAIHAFDLAGRGAYFAARSEFITALRLLVQGLDSERKTNVHSQALAAALTAMEEAEDFIPSGARLEANLDLKMIVEGHVTKVLKGADFDTLTSMLALRGYLTFAQEKLVVAVDNEVAGSMALHGLGKLYVALARHKDVSVVAAEPKAMVCFQAAILAFPGNYMAANDLGVLLARAGHLVDAQVVLEHTAGLHPQPAVWRNLVMVYRRLGRDDLAQVAAARAAQRGQAVGAPEKESAVAVQWLDPTTFAKISGGVGGEGPTAPAAASPSPVVSATGVMPANDRRDRPSTFQEFINRPLMSSPAQPPMSSPIVTRRSVAPATVSPVSAAGAARTAPAPSYSPFRR